LTGPSAEIPSTEGLPALPPARRLPLLPERSDFLEGDTPAAEKVAKFLTAALDASGGDDAAMAGALVPWICDSLQSNHSVKAYGRDLIDFFRHMQGQGVSPPGVTGDHVRLYKRALLEAGLSSATVARRLSVLRGAYEQFATKGLVGWEVAHDIAAVKASGVQKNSTPSLTQRQAIALLKAIPTHSLQGVRDLALMSVFFLTGCRVSAVIGACVGHLETDGVEHFLNVTEKRNKKRRKILLDAARPVLAYVASAGIGSDREGPLFRPLTPDGLGLARRHLDRKTPWRLVKNYCEAAGIDHRRLGGRGIGIHSLRKTAINDAIRNGATMHEVREFAGHADIRTTEVYFIRREEDAVRWTPETGPVVKIENQGSERRGFEDGKDKEVAHGSVQVEGGVSGGEGTGDGEPVGIGARGPPDADSSMEEAVAGRSRGSLQQRPRTETFACRGGARIGGAVRADWTIEDGVGVAQKKS
jgi:integrase/recombinase XerD